MTAGEPLTLAGGKAFVERLRVLGIPLAERFAPGLSTEEIAALEVQFETKFPPELATWWRWSNGMSLPTAEQARDPAHRHMWPGPGLLSAAYAHERAVMMRQIALETGFEPECPVDRIWPGTWVPLTLHISGGLLFCDAAAGRPDATCAVHYASVRILDSPVEVTATIGGLLVRWLELFDQGYFFFDQARQEWVSRDAPEPTDTPYLRG